MTDHPDPPADPAQDPGTGPAVPPGPASTGPYSPGPHEPPQTPYGPPPYGPAPYGPPPAPYGPPPYGPAPYGPAQYGPAQYGQAPYGSPPPGPAAQWPAAGPPDSGAGPYPPPGPYGHGPHGPQPPAQPPGNPWWPGGRPVGPAPDPLEQTRSDAAPTRPARRLGPRARRITEAAVLAVLLPGLVTVQWLDDSHTAGGHDTTTTVPRGATATLGHTQWRMLGRAADGGRSFTPGAVTVTLILLVRPMDAQGVKQADPTDIGFRLRDRAGHVWTAGTGLGDDTKPAAGQITQVAVTGDVPARLAGSVVLEMHLGSSYLSGPKHWYRFAH